MNVVLIGADKTVCRYLPQSVFKVDYYQDVQAATQNVDYSKSDAVLLDISGAIQQDYSPLGLLLQRKQVPVIVLGNDVHGQAGGYGIIGGVHNYLSKNKLNSQLLSRLVIEAGITKEIQMKMSQTDLFSQFREHNDPCDLLFHDLPFGIFVLNQEKRVLYINAFMEEILCCRKQGIFNHFLTQFLYPDDIPVYLEQICSLGEGQKNGEFESRFLSNESEPSWWLLNLSYLPVVGNEAGCYLILARDISQEKQNQELLINAKKGAEEANRAKTDFLSNMSHEIRTPIHTIMGMSELLLDTSLNNEQKKYVNRIRFSLDALLTLVNHILDFSRLEAGDMTVAEVEFNLPRMLENILDLVIHHVNKKHLEIALYIGPDVPELVKGDPRHLQQIIRHLLNNAVKFTEEGEIILSVTRLSDPGSRVKLRFSVKDTGNGIDADRVQYIFHPFAQTESVYSRECGSTGVGLSIVKKLVEHLRGEIFVTSTKGEGSEFYFELNFQDHADVLPAPAGASQVLSGKNILLIGNSQASLTILGQYVSEWGGQSQQIHLDRFLSTLTRAPAEKLYGNFDLGIIELQVPDMQKVLEAIPRLQAGKYLLLRPTGFLIKQSLSLLARGFAGCLARPVRKRVLFGTIYHQICRSEFQSEAVSLLPSANEQKDTSSPGSTETPRVRILVVEDHEVNREFFCTILNKMGYKVKKATDGVEAVRMSELYTFDLIFMDIQMPGMNGYDVTRLLREKGLKIPIIAVTANTVRGEISRCLQAGMNDYMAKPFKRTDLVPLLDKWLDNGQSHGPVEVEETASRDQTLSVFDFEKAVEMFMGQKKVVLRLLAPFVVRLAEQLKNMEEALARGEYLTIQHEAHTIKGGALNIQAIELGTCALELEKAARTGQINQLAPQIVLLKKAYQQFKTAVDEVLKESQVVSQKGQFRS